VSERQPARLRALSLIQPWATLIAVGAKRVETRSWRPTRAGAPPWPLAVHAARTFPAWARDLCAQAPFAGVLAAAGYPDPARLPRGVIVATCTVVAVRATAGGEALFSLSLPDRTLAGWAPAEFEHAFGDYSPNRWAWLLDRVTPLPVPIPARGALGLWVLPAPVGSLQEIALP
jgi:hypothetical protein